MAQPRGLAAFLLYKGNFQGATADQPPPSRGADDPPQTPPSIPDRIRTADPHQTGQGQPVEHLPTGCRGVPASTLTQGAGFEHCQTRTK